MRYSNQIIKEKVPIELLLKFDVALLATREGDVVMYCLPSMILHEREECMRDIRALLPDCDLWIAADPAENHASARVIAARAEVYGTPTTREGPERTRRCVNDCDDARFVLERGKALCMACAERVLRRPQLPASRTSECILCGSQGIQDCSTQSCCGPCSVVLRASVEKGI